MVSDVGSKTTVPKVRRNDAPKLRRWRSQGGDSPAAIWRLQNEVKGSSAQDRRPLIRFDQKGNTIRCVDLPGLPAFARRELYVPNMVKLYVTFNQLFKKSLINVNGVRIYEILVAGIDLRRCPSLPKAHEHNGDIWKCTFR